MNKDTRITVGLALIYFFNGFLNVYGTGKAFMPLVFLDSVLLAALSLTFALLPPARKQNTFFVWFALIFAMQECVLTGVFQQKSVDLVLQVLFLLTCLVGYTLPLIKAGSFLPFVVVPFLVFGTSITLGFLGIQGILVVVLAGIGALFQVYILARPDVVEKIPLLTKRFYLLMTSMAFFDVLSYIFLHSIKK